MSCGDSFWSHVKRQGTPPTPASTGRPPGTSACSGGGVRPGGGGARPEEAHPFVPVPAGGPTSQVLRGGLGLADPQLPEEVPPAPVPEQDLPAPMDNDWPKPHPRVSSRGVPLPASARAEAAVPPTVPGTLS